MDLEFTFENPSHSWSVLHVFKQYFNLFVNKQQKLNIKYKNSSGQKDRFAGGVNSAHIMTIKNIKNGKYILVSYWDNVDDLLIESNGWDVKNCVEIITSSGVKNNTVTPFSYLPYSIDFDMLSKNAKSIINKTKNDLTFRGYLYGNRLQLKNHGKIKITHEKITPIEKYFDDLTDTKICLSLDGAGEICNRDIEIMSAKSVLLRPKLTFKFHNDLIPDYHYISFERDDNPKTQSEIILEKYNQVINNYELLEYISNNGYQWYLENGTISSNVNILDKIINIDKLK